MRNEDLLDAIKKLFDDYDTEQDELSKDVAGLKGQLTEMIRHNGEKFDAMKNMYDRFIKILLSIIVIEFIIIAVMLGLKASDIPIPFIFALGAVSIKKKITDIRIQRLPLVERIKDGVNLPNTAAYCYSSLPDVMFISPDGEDAKNQEYWEENLVTIITHETLHFVLDRLKLDPKNGFDNRKIFRRIARSHFLVDCKWKWLRYRWEWENGKWVRKKIFY